MPLFTTFNTSCDSFVSSCVTKDRSKRQKLSFPNSLYTGTTVTTPSALSGAGNPWPYFSIYLVCASRYLSSGGNSSKFDSSLASRETNLESSEFFAFSNDVTPPEDIPIQISYALFKSAPPLFNFAFPPRKIRKNEKRRGGGGRGPPGGGRRREPPGNEIGRQSTDPPRAKSARLGVGKIGSSVVV